jgi:acyl-CoA thioester hydrolase
MGRTEFLREVGIPYTTIEERELYFPVIEVSGRYLRPARFDDEILVETTLDSLGGAMLRFNYKIYHQTDGSLLTTGWTKHACVGGKGQVAQIPSDLRAELSEHVSEITTRGRHRPQS